MILLLNGAFGVGKTTVARALARRLPRSVVFDPEPIGVALQRAARLAGRRVDDFQDDIVHSRLQSRGADRHKHRWQYEHAAACCAVHGRPEFATQVPAAGRNVDEVVNDLIALLN